MQTAFPGCGAFTGMAAVACGAKSMSVTSGGTASARVFPAVAATGASTTAWTKGDLVVVCVAVRAASFTRFVPLPNSGVIQSKTVMSIENGSAPTPVNFTGDTDPSGQELVMVSVRVESATLPAGSAFVRAGPPAAQRDIA